MKKIFLILLFSLGLIPALHKGKIQFLFVQSVHADDFGSEDAGGDTMPSIPSGLLTDFGEGDPNGDLNSVISDTNFDDFLDNWAANGATYGDPVQQTYTQDGVDYPGQVTECRGPDGTLLAAFFSPDCTCGPFQEGMEYNLVGTPAVAPPADDGTNAIASPDYIPPTFEQTLTEFPLAPEISPTYQYIQEGSTLSIPGSSPALPAAFQYFNLNTILTDIQNRIYKPSLVNQGATGLCGPALITKLFIEQDPTGYKDLVVKLYQYGKVTYTPSNFTVSAYNSVVANDLLNADPNGTYYQTNTSNMAQADFILLASLRNTSNFLLHYDYANDSWGQFSGVTYPSDMENYLRNFLQWNYVANETDLIVHTHDYTHLENIILNSTPGNKILMLIDDNMLNPNNYGFSSPYATHWVQYLTGLTIDVPNNAMSFKVWCWGRVIQVNVPIDVFNKFYYGAIYGQK